MQIKEIVGKTRNYIEKLRSLPVSEREKIMMAIVVFLGVIFIIRWIFLAKQHIENIDLNNSIIPASYSNGIQDQESLQNQINDLKNQINNLSKNNTTLK